MSDLGPGDRVECIDARPADGGQRRGWRLTTLLVKGALYTVDRLREGLHGDGCLYCGGDHLFVSLVEVGADVEEDGFCPKRFRPLRGMFDALKAGTEGFVEVDVDAIKAPEPAYR